MGHSTRKQAARRAAKRPYPTLLAWRLAQNLNQHDAAKLLGVSQPVYSRLERRVQFPVAEEAKRLMDTTGVSLEVLVGVA